MEQAILNDYQQRASLAQQEVNKYKTLVNTYSFLRLSIFVLLAVAVYIGAVNDTFTIVAIAFIVLVLFFAWLVSKQSGFERQLKYFLDLKQINENETGSIVSYANLYDNGSPFASEKHYYSSDLDIFGNASL